MKARAFVGMREIVWAAIPAVRMTREPMGLIQRGRMAVLTAVIALAVAGGAAVPARAQSPTGAVAQAGTSAGAAATDSAKATAPAATVAPSFFTDILANAFVSLGYTYNINTPTSRLNGFRVFDADVNTFGVDVAELVLQKTVSKVGETGFRADFEVGSAIPQKTQAYGLSVGQSADLQQAFLSYIAPVGVGLRLDIGKHVTHMGYELIEGYDGYNDNYSRSLLFNYAIPLTHTGVKASYAFGPKVSAMMMVVNGWDNAKDNNEAKSIGGQLTLVPVAPLTVLLNYLGGSEKTDTSGFWRSTYDVVATWKATKVLTLGLNADYATEKKASLVKPGADAVWMGVAGYAKVDATSILSLALRAETFKDEGGTRLGAGSSATVSEVTLTPSVKVGDRMILRSDLRFDRANLPLFTKNSAQATKQQTTIALNLAFVY